MEIVSLAELASQNIDLHITAQAPPGAHRIYKASRNRSEPQWEETDMEVSLVKPRRMHIHAARQSPSRIARTFTPIWHHSRHIVHSLSPPHVGFLV